MNFIAIDKKVFRPYLFFILLLFCFAEAKSQNLTPQQLTDDLEFLKHELPKKHKNLFAKISETTFNNKIAEIIQKIELLNNESFEIELYKLIKKIDDEHTRIEPIYKTVYPLSFDFFEEGIFVTSTDTTHSYLLYKKLDGIENSTIKEITENFEKIIKTDNQSYFDVYFQHFVNNPRILKGLDITQSDSIVNFILDNEKYQFLPVINENFTSKPISNLLKYSNNDNYWYKLINNSKILYFNYQVCSEQDGKPFEPFANELFSVIQNKKPQKIIIDLRNNSGGNSAILDPFLKKLSKSYLNKNGSLYVLIGKNTFSSALMNAVDLKRNYKSILVGQPTSGNVNHYGETRGFRLPNSKIIVGYSTKYWEIWKGYNGALRPDIEIKYSINNYKKNIDEAIEYVTNLK